MARYIYFIKTCAINTICLQAKVFCIHYNENCNKDQAVTKAGTKRYSISFPKQKQGGHTVRQLKVTSTYSECCRVINYIYIMFVSV